MYTGRPAHVHHKPAVLLFCCLQVGPSLAINYMAYETMRSVWLARTDRQTPTVRALRAVAAAVATSTGHRLHPLPWGFVCGVQPPGSQPAMRALLLALLHAAVLTLLPSPLLPTPSAPHPLPPQVAMSLACGSAAGLVSSTATFPLDLVRRRLQLHGQGGSSAAAAGGGPPAATFRSVLSGVVQVRAASWCMPGSAKLLG